jgi:DNA-binding MarR family transcriptional regulator
LRPLQRDGLVRLDKNPADRRSTWVVLTEEGRQRYDQMCPLWRQAQDQVVAVLGASVTEQLLEQLIGIAQNDGLSVPPERTG